MSRTITALALSLVAAGSLMTAASAWNASGHEQIADIAWTQLTPHARDEVVNILAAGDPLFAPKRWTAEEVRKSFRRAATFPDDLKIHTNTLYEPWVAPMNERWHPESDPKVTGDEKTRCYTWHYYETPVRVKGTPPPVRESNALNALILARAELERLQKDPNPDRRAQAWWLCWIEHLTGDIHEPLNCASSFEFEATGDSGGKLFAIRNESKHLRAYWGQGIDRAIGEEKQLGLGGEIEEVTQRWTSDRSRVPSASDAANLDVKSWIEAGARLADTKAYEGIRPGDSPSGRYRKSVSDACSRQAVLAGYRLANTLNSILDPDGAKSPKGGKRRK